MADNNGTRSPKRAVRQVGTPAKPEENTVAPEDDIFEAPQDMLSLLQEIVTEEAKNPDLTLKVPNRPRMKLVFSPNFDFDSYNAWIRRATNKKTDEVNWGQLSAVVISNTNTAILLDDTRTSYTVTASELHTSLGVAVGGTRQAIKVLYGSEGHAIQVAKEIIDKAGYTIDGDIQEDAPLDD